LDLRFCSVDSLLDLDFLLDADFLRSLCLLLNLDWLLGKTCEAKGGGRRWLLLRLLS